MKKAVAILVLVAIVALGSVAVYAKINDNSLVSVTENIPRPNED